MSATRTNLQAARDSIAGVLGKRRTTTETELDECVETLKELKNACDLLGKTPPAHAQLAERLSLAHGAIDEVAERIKNRKRSPQ